MGYARNMYTGLVYIAYLNGLVCILECVSMNTGMVSTGWYGICIRMHEK